MLPGFTPDTLIPSVSRLDLIAETILAANASRIEITGLDLNTHKGYIVILTTRNIAGLTVHPMLYFNNDLVDANYWTRLIGLAAVNSARLVVLSNNCQLMAALNLGRPPDGHLTWVGPINHCRGGGIFARSGVGVHQTVQANLTQITFLTRHFLTGAEVVGFEAGTIVRVYGYLAG